MSSFLNKLTQGSNSTSNANDAGNTDSGLTSNNNTASATTGSNQNEDYGDKGTLSASVYVFAIDWSPLD